MLNHLKYSLPDWILCTLASVGIGINVVQSFYLPEALSRDALRIALVSAVVIAVMIVCSYSKLTAIIAGIIVVIGIIQVLVMSALGYLQGFSESENPEANARLWYLVVVICALLVYLASRTRISSWILLIIGMIAAAYFAILEYQVYLWGELLFVFSVGAWLCFIGYRRNMLKISVMRTAFVPTIGWSAGMALICLLLGCFLWWGVVRPLQPPTQDMVLLTDYLQMNQLERLGLISEEEIYDSSLYSQWLNENLSELTNQAQGAQESEEDALSAQGTQQESAGTQEEYNEDSDSEQNARTAPLPGIVHWITYETSHLILTILIVLLLVLAVAALIVLFLNRRKLWYRRKVRDMDDSTYIRFFYGWYLSRFRRLKLPVPGGDTPLEYARRTETSTRFLNDTGVSWKEITEIFARQSYSGRPARPEDRAKYEQFYSGFVRCCRKHFRLAWIFYALRV